MMSLECYLHKFTFFYVFIGENVGIYVCCWECIYFVVLWLFDYLHIWKAGRERGEGLRSQSWLMVDWQGVTHFHMLEELLKNVIWTRSFDLSSSILNYWIFHYLISFSYTQSLFFSPKMGDTAQLNFAQKISGEFLSIWAKFPQISKFFGWTMDEIRLNRKKFARHFWGRTSTARIRPVRPKKYLLCSLSPNLVFSIISGQISPSSPTFHLHHRIPSIIDLLSSSGQFCAFISQ
jgi:hypothetical protein